MTVPAKPLINALKGIPAERPPVWLMRQAGRYLPEYRAIRSEVGGFLDLCYTPERAIEVTLQPVRRFGLDAAILFSDILVVPHALGVEVAFLEGEGPRLEPLRDRGDLDRLSAARLQEHMAPVYAALSGVGAALPGEVALIGFAGAPWTLAAYMLEGGGSKEYAKARELARREPEFMARLIDLLVDAVAEFLLGQIDAGAEVVQIFDSWAGVLPPDQREAFSTAPIGRIVERVRAVRPEVPVIVFPRGIGGAYAEVNEALDADALSLDTTVDPAWAAAALPPAKVPCLQGNLDPLALVVGGEAMALATARILEAWRGRAFIFNLGHGVVPHTPPEHVAELVDSLKSGGT